jgi:hypothetical protein
MVRTSMDRSDKWMVYETLYQTSNITNASTSKDEDSLLQKDRFHAAGGRIVRISRIRRALRGRDGRSLRLRAVKMHSKI